MRIIFAGTPSFAASHLEALIDSEHDVVAVITQPDRPGKRGKIGSIAGKTTCGPTWCAGTTTYEDSRERSH